MPARTKNGGKMEKKYIYRYKYMCSYVYECLLILSFLIKYILSLSVIDTAPGTEKMLGRESVL